MQIEDTERAAVISINWLSRRTEVSFFTDKDAYTQALVYLSFLEEATAPDWCKGKGWEHSLHSNKKAQTVYSNWKIRNLLGFPPEYK